jgi:carbon-monoxide dehydrogenase medium subunit
MMLNGQIIDERLIRQTASLAAEEVDPPDDIHADATYRRGLAATLVKRALRAATGKASA